MAKRVLAVDDSETTRALLRAALDTDEWEVETAGSADEALALARKARPDVMLLDFVLPDVDGIVLLREMRRWGVDAPVIALTGASSTEVAYRFIRAGAADFLRKEGLERADVQAAVRRALRIGAAGVRYQTPRWKLPSDAATHALMDDPSEPAEEQVGPLRILVIDDTASARAAVRATLSRCGWSVDEASDVRSALERIRAAPPDAVLLDYLLPDINGIEAIAVLSQVGLQAPILALTGHGSEELADRFLRAGAADFLGKDDLSEERLVHAIQRAVAVYSRLARATAPHPPGAP